MQGPPWFKKKNHLFKSYMANGRLVVDCVRLQKAGAELINIVESLKEKLLHQPRQKNK